MDFSVNLPPLDGFEWVELEKRDPNNPRFFPPAKPETIAAAEEWCPRELGFPLPEFYAGALRKSNGLRFCCGRFLIYPEPGHPGFLEGISLISQNRRFRRRRKPWRLASHFFVFGRFWGKNYLVYDTRKGSFHLFSPLFPMEDASQALASFEDWGSFVEGLLRGNGSEEDPAWKLAESIDPLIEKQLLAERRPQARFDPTSLPVLEAALEPPSDDWPPTPASPEAIEKAIEKAPLWLNGYPLPLFYRELLPYYNGLPLKNGCISCIQDERSPLEWMRKDVAPQDKVNPFLFWWNYDLFRLEEDECGRGALREEERAVNPEFFCFGGSMFLDPVVEYWVYDPRTVTFHKFYNDSNLSTIFGASVSSPDLETFIRDVHYEISLPVPEEEEGKE
ncbi:MAG: hypothetical protein PHO89_10805 [Methylacidiphilaceae bacterium]|nr:hypothetical protein [Candidatus Methylacidiphilaceae bacterium]